MKKLKVFLMILGFSLTTLLVFSQKATWTAMEDFHAVMSVSFHPAEENNLKPVRENAANLLKKAKDWRASEVPAGFNGATVKPILKKLIRQCRLVKVAVDNNKADEDLKIMITGAHDIFHEITEKCRM